MDKHIKTLGLFHVIFGVFGIGSAYSLAALLGMHTLPFYNHAWHFDYLPQIHIMNLHSTDLLHWLGLHLFGAITLVSLAQIIGGCGVLGRKQWARVVIIIVGILILPSFPFGTALGIYTLWVMFRPEIKEIMVS